MGAAVIIGIAAVVIWTRRKTASDGKQSGLSVMLSAEQQAIGLAILAIGCGLVGWLEWSTHTVC